MPESPNFDPTQLLVDEILKEKRSNRRWKNFRFACWFLLFVFVIAYATGLTNRFSGDSAPGGQKKYVALIRLDGMIAPGRDFSAEEVVPILDAAFSDKGAEGVIIDINSPGGTPVQAAIIHDAIISFKKKHHKRVIVVGEDLLTSGAYYVAVAADNIYVNPNTITGSVGVIMKGFGFVEAMKKIGVERRVYIAGNEKDRLDPFLPQTPEDVDKIKTVMAEVHQNFEDAVVEGRKGRLHADPSTLFTGDFWPGTSALKLGLVDGLGNLMDVSEKEFKTSRFKEYGNTTNFFKMLESQLTSVFDNVFFSTGL